MPVMQFAYYVFGFVSGFVLTCGCLAIIYFYLKKSRDSKPRIRGYLDLIPDLTDSQREKVETIRRVFLPRVASIRENLYEHRRELAKLLFEEPAKRSLIDATMKEVVSHQTELEMEVVEHILEEKELLTSTQKRKFYEIIIEQFSGGGLGVHDVKGRQ